MIRRIDTWSVLRVAVLFYLSLMLVMVLAGVMLWAAGSLFGAVDSVESFMRGIGFEGFEFVGGQLLRGFTAVGLILVVLGTGSTVLAALLYNLIADVVGGIQLTVLEEVYVADEERLPIAVDRTGEEWAVAAAAPVEAVETGTATSIITDEGDTTVAAPAAPLTGGSDAADAASEPVASDPAPAADPQPATIQEPEPRTVQEPEPQTVQEPEPATIAEPAPAEQPEQRAEGREALSTEPSDGSRDGNGNGWTTPAWQPASRSQWADQRDG